MMAHELISWHAAYASEAAKDPLDRAILAAARDRAPMPREVTSKARHGPRRGT